MTKRLLSCALAAALGGAAVPAGALTLGFGHDGTGDAVLLPYFTTEQSQAVLLTVTNHSEATKAVRLLIAEARAGRPLLSLNLYLAPRDTWTGALTSAGADQPTLLSSDDASCASINLETTQVPLQGGFYTDQFHDGLGTDVARTHSGFIEVIEMGELTGSARDSVLAKQCGELRLRLATGSWSVRPNEDVTAPTGGLSAQAQVVDVAQGYAFRVAGQALRGLNGRARHTLPREWPEVRLTTPTPAGPVNHLEIEGWGKVPMARQGEAASLLFMTRELESAYTVASSLDADTRFVVTYPTRHAHVDAGFDAALPRGTLPRAPFVLDPEPGAAHCEAVEWRILRADGSVAGERAGAACASVTVHRLLGGQAPGAAAPDSVDTFGVDTGRAVLAFESADHRLEFTPPGATKSRYAVGLPAVGQTITVARNANAQPGLLAAYAVTQPAVARRVGVEGVVPPPSAACQDPLVQPPGWTLELMTWETAWSAPNGRFSARFPDGFGFPIPIGADKGTIKTIPFIPTADLSIELSWETAQANGLVGYVQPRPADLMFIAVSPCAADVRAVNAAASDPFLHPSCRVLAAEAEMILSTRAGTNQTACRLQPNQRYYMTVAPVDPSNGLTPGEHTCSNTSPNSASGCDVQAFHRGN